jgi:hypothetical protein
MFYSYDDRPAQTWGRTAALSLFPLVLAAIWASTALSVEISPPRFDAGIWRFGVDDFLLNVVLYLPLGMALRRRPFLFALAAGAGLSTGVEILQSMYVGRYPGVADVAANTTGTVAGWVFANYKGRGWMRGIDPIPLTRSLAIFAAAVFALGVAFLSVPGPPSGFTNWDPTCRLIVGDELTRNRPWKGTIGTIAVFDRTLASREIEKCSRLDATSRALRIVSLSPIYFTDGLASLDSIRGTPLLDDAEQRRFYDGLVDAGRLSLLVWFATHDENQTGPARIVGDSKSPFDQNFSLGQQNRDVIFRLRTPTTVPGGFFPQTTTRPLLKKNRDTFVAATYDGRNVRVYADGRYEARLNLCARGRPAPFFSDSGLPASATFIGTLAGVVCVGLLRGSRSRYRLILAGGLGGLAGGTVLVLTGGALAFPAFAPFLPAVSAWGGSVVGCSVIPPGGFLEA